MKTLTTLALLVAAVILSLSIPLFAALQLVPVASGLSSPLFVGHAGDGSNRLFIVERGGIIKVQQPGASSSTVFLDIRGRVVAGGEQGLLGLAFHPFYESNGRFFVFYTTSGNTLVIAEYRVSANPNVAGTTEQILFTVPHPGFTNHNGGMLAFGPDGYLYIGVGDGGGANDPSNNAQNLDVLLGKILRIDVDPPEGSATPYVSPQTNPFYGMSGMRPEIFAYGLRNPWRFSFDRFTGQQWVTDVGQGAREEVDVPIVSGGNYGWRVYEGFSCTNNDPALCGSSAYIPPRFEYAHANGRCSITGGHVYRGSQGAVADGTYIYGDYCTGEIFGWDGTAQTVLLDTALNISSFGEDESGELYVVGLGGTVSRLASAPSCSYAIAPTTQAFGAGAGTGSVSVTAGSGCGWSAVSNASWIRVTSGGSGSGSGAVGYAVDANTATASRTGTMTIAGRTFTVNQDGAPASCTYSISPARATFPAAGGTGSVSVTAAGGCGWTAASEVSWITVTSGSAGNGPGTATYSVAAYTGRPGTRNGKLTIAGQTFTVKQQR